MKITDRYIVREFVKPFFISLLIFIFLYLLIQFLQNLGGAVKEGGKLYLLLRDCLLQIPLIFVQLSPLAVLLSSLLVLGIFSRHNEIIAFQVAGISIYRIFLPFLLIGLFLSGISFLVNDRIVPPLSLKIERSENEISGITFRTKDKMLYAQLFSQKEKVLSGIQISTYSTKYPAKIINAKKAVYIDKEIWLLKNGISRRIDQQGNYISQHKFNSLKINLGVNPETLSTNYQKTEQLSFKKLLSYTQKLKEDGLYPRIQLVELQNKIAFPLINFFVLFLVLPFLLSFHLSASKFFGVGFSILGCFFYYWIFSLGIAMGKEGLLPPFLSAWFANISLGAIGLSLSVFVRR